MSRHLPDSPVRIFLLEIWFLHLHWAHHQMIHCWLIKCIIITMYCHKILSQLCELTQVPHTGHRRVFLVQSRFIAQLSGLITQNTLNELLAQQHDSLNDYVTPKFKFCHYLLIWDQSCMTLFPTKWMFHFCRKINGYSFLKIKAFLTLTSFSNLT